MNQAKLEIRRADEVDGRLKDSAQNFYDACDYAEKVINNYQLLKLNMSVPYGARHQMHENML